jgi:ABC-type transport system involved in cytochrome bd biosynthesis fused ATPase/permease subunit
MAMLKNSTFAAVFSTAYLVLLLILVLIGYADSAALLLILSPLLVIWLVYIVLRYGEASGRTFDKYFYDDANIRVDKLRE